MADVSLADLGSASSPLPGLDPSDYGGYGAGGNQTDPSSGSFNPLSLGPLALGAGGFGAILAQGPGSLPPQFGTLQTNATDMTGTGQRLVAQGQGMVGKGEEALAMATRGELTPEQAAALKQYGTGLTNQTRQQFFNMGQNPDQSTAYISQTADNDAKVIAMAQSQIQTTIQLGLGQISGGGSLIGQGQGFESAANNVLLQAGEAQLKADQAYSSNLTSAFASIGQLFGAAAKVAPLLAV